MVVALAAMGALGLTGCSTLSGRAITMNGRVAGDTLPAPIKKVSAVPKLRTHSYAVLIYPGLGKKYNPNPELTLEELNDIRQLDDYCARQADKVHHDLIEAAEHAGTYGFLEALAAWSYKLGFSFVRHAGGYMTVVGLVGAGGGLANEKVAADEFRDYTQYSCMATETQKADELEKKLRRISIAPTPSGSVELPGVSADPAPRYASGEPNPTMPIAPPPQ